MDPRAEARHPSAAELFALDLVDPQHRLALAVTVAFVGADAACTMSLVGAGRRATVLVEPDAGRPRGLELRAPGLWADLQCLVPFDHVTLDVEAFAIALDDPADAEGEPRGERVAFGLEVEWDTAPGVPAPVPQVDEDGVTSYELACRVHGIVLVGDERLEVDGFGSRRHAWGPVAPWARPWARTVTAAGVADGWPAPAGRAVVAAAPLRSPAAGALGMDRALVVVQDPTPSLAWIERNLPC